MIKLILIYLLLNFTFKLELLTNFMTQGSVPEKNVEFVWSLFVNYQEAFHAKYSVPETPKIYILENVPNVFIPRQTVTYYWPIDREWKVDWGLYNQEVDGELVIRATKSKSLFNEQVLTLTDFIVTSPGNQPGPKTILLLDNQAITAYEKYELERDQYLKLSSFYDRELFDYYKTNLTSPQKELTIPKKPETFTQVLSKPNKAFIINLPAGEYSIFLRSKDGEKIKGSDRTLIVDSYRNKGVAFTIIPEEKWTKVENSYLQNQVIYLSNLNKVLYISPFDSVEYNELFLMRLINPQEKISSDKKWTWIINSNIKDVILEVLVNNEVVQKENLKYFKVNQIPGESLGYKIEEFTPLVNETPDFSAFKFVPISGVKTYSIRLVKNDGQIIPKSVREIRIINQNNSSFVKFIIVFSIFPILYIFIKHFYHKRKSKIKIKEIFNQ